MHPVAALIELGRSQGGPVAARQALAVGLSTRTFHRLVERHGWPRPFRGVAVLPGSPLDREVLARAAALSVGPHAIITGESALHLRGVTDEPASRITLVVPASLRTEGRPGVRVIRSRTIRDDDWQTVRGVRLARPARAVLDGAGRASLDRIRRWLVDGRQREHLDVGEVAWRAEQAPSVPGRKRILQACRQVSDSGADSMLVVEVERRLRALGVPLDVPPRTVAVPGRVLHPDVTVRDVPVGLEVDGYGAHRSRSGMDLDQRKHNAYRLAGWWILRVGWDRLSADWQGFVDELLRAIQLARSG